MKPFTRSYLPLTIVVVVLLVSTACAGFLAGRTSQLHENGEPEQMEQLRDGVVTSITLLHRGVEVVKSVILR